MTVTEAKKKFETEYPEYKIIESYEGDLADSHYYAFRIIGKEDDEEFGVTQAAIIDDLDEKIFFVDGINAGAIFNELEQI